jgi:hypothetical protein
LATVRTSGPVCAILSQLGANYTARANANLASGAGYRGQLHIGPGAYNRAIFNIYTLTGEAKRDNSKNQTLAKLL